MSDDRRFLELSELFLDDELSPAETAELRHLLEAEPAMVRRLHGILSDQVICRTALRPADAHSIGERTRRMVESWRPQSGEIAAQAVFASVDRRRRNARILRWSSVAAAALVVLLCAPFLLPTLLRPVAQPDQHAPRLSAVSGDVRLGALQIREPGEPLVFGATIRVADGGSATVQYPDGTTMQVGGGSVLTRQYAAGQRLELAAGSLAVVASKRPPDQPLEIVCPDATVRVVGTRFHLAVHEGASELAVDEGLVRHERLSDGVWSLVGAGQRSLTTRLPQPRPVLMSVDHLAALRTAIAAGRQPWTSNRDALQAELPELRQEPLPEEGQLIPVPRYGGPESAIHSRARSILHRLCRPMVGFAVWARLNDDPAAVRESLLRIQRALSVRLEGEEADLLTTDMLVVHVLQSAGLLRALAQWEDADSRRIDAWLVGTAEPAVRRLMETRGPTSRWRGIAAQMAIYAWRADQTAMISLMATLRSEVPRMLSPEQSQTLADGPIENTSLYQIMCHVLLAADLARVAAGDITPPPPAWQAAVTAFFQRRERLGITSKRQEHSLVCALAGPDGWRTPAARPFTVASDGVDHSYGWYFPTLQLIDPRWE